MSWVVTEYQLSVLRKLQGSRERRQQSFGLNACEFGGEKAAAAARRLDRKGYVVVDRISERHLRYSISSSGEQLIRSIDAGRPWMVKRYRR